MDGEGGLAQPKVIQGDGDFAALESELRRTTFFVALNDGADVPDGWAKTTLGDQAARGLRSLRESRDRYRDAGVSQFGDTMTHYGNQTQAALNELEDTRHDLAYWRALAGKWHRQVVFAAPWTQALACASLALCSVLMAYVLGSTGIEVWPIGLACVAMAVMAGRCAWMLWYRPVQDAAIPKWASDDDGKRLVGLQAENNFICVEPRGGISFEIGGYRGKAIVTMSGRGTLRVGGLTD